MRSNSRRFLAAILLTAAAGFALSQEASAPPPPPAPDVAAPVAELPQHPVVVAPVPDPNAPAVDRALTIDQSVLPVAPAAETIVQVAEPEKPVVAATTSRVTRKSATKPVVKPSVEAKDSLQPAPAPPAAANTADPSTFQGLNPPNAAATSALPKTIAGAAPAATAATVEDQPQQTSPQKKRLGVGSWILGTILILALIATAIRFKGGQTRSPTSIVDFTDIHPELSAAPVRRS